MKPEDYQAFTDDLQQQLESDERVLALVALGSTAQSERQDQWSDHDFWVITVPGAQDYFLNELNWLPNYREITLALRQASHYYTVLYRSGHMVEFAIFDTPQLQQGKLNNYRLLFDKQNIAEAIQPVYHKTISGPLNPYSDTLVFGNFIICLWKGVELDRRGEKLSGHHYVVQTAMGCLLMLLAKYIPPQPGDLLDNLDVRRRFELAYPSLGAELNAMLFYETPKLAAHLLDLADRLLHDSLADYPQQAVDTIRGHIQTQTP